MIAVFWHGSNMCCLSSNLIVCSNTLMDLSLFLLVWSLMMLVIWLKIWCLFSMSSKTQHSRLGYSPLWVRLFKINWLVIHRRCLIFEKHWPKSLAHNLPPKVCDIIPFYITLRKLIFPCLLIWLELSIFSIVWRVVVIVFPWRSINQPL